MPTPWNASDRRVFRQLHQAAAQAGLDIAGGQVRRSSSRFCLGVEHGDYNGTELFGVGTDRFFWLAYKPNGTPRTRLFSVNFPDDGVVAFESGQVPPPRDPAWSHSSARFPHGVDHVLRANGFALPRGYDAVIAGNVPGGGMSRSASISINLILTALEVNGHRVKDGFKIVEMAQQVENDYIGSPCGQLDQIMIYFARAGMGTHYNPRTRTIKHVALGPQAPEFRIISLDTGTVRPGLEKSTYKLRRAECDELAAAAGAAFGFAKLADIRDDALLARVLARFGQRHPGPCDRLRYIYAAQQRFGRMLKAWRAGDVATVGAIFRADGLGLRDQYRISGAELETMCDLVRTVPGVWGERMLGGGDKGAAGALCAASAVPALRRAVATGYPRAHPDFATKWAVHECRMVDGITVGPLPD